MVLKHFPPWPVSYSEPSPTFHLIVKLYGFAPTLDPTALRAAPSAVLSRLSPPTAEHSWSPLQPVWLVFIYCVPCDVELTLVIKIKQQICIYPCQASKEGRVYDKWLSLKFLSLVNQLLFKKFWELWKDTSLSVYVSSIGSFRKIHLFGCDGYVMPNRWYSFWVLWDPAIILS